MATVKTPSRRTIHGIKKKHAAPTAARRGTVESVFSCSEVSTCSRLITRLTSTAMASTGAVSTMAASSVRRESSTTKSVDIAFPSAQFPSETFHQRAHQQVPAIHHHEQQNLQRRRNHYRRQLKHAD